ncbi:MAG: very short patch repair endonuclease [Atopobiaceae bacterium]|nr:very short patch repair endonuclease [Atopobiaceae bacterium]
MTSEATRHVMQANKSKNTKPELLVRAALRDAGHAGYRLHWKKAPGHPDICFPGRKVAIFVNGCFWHRCPRCALPAPKSNVEFWEGKFARNRTRDAYDQELLLKDGWTVLVVWECQLGRQRIEPTMHDLILELERVDEERGRGVRVPRVVEVRPRGWRLRVRQGRLRRS